MDRRSFFRRGVVVGMAGALLGVGSQEVGASPYATSVPPGLPMTLPELSPLPRLPADEQVAVEMEFTGTATRRAGYDWSESARTIIDPAREYMLHVTIDGREYVIGAWPEHN